VQRFVDALFRPKDLILLRPIETWTEGGEKRSQVVYKEIGHHRANDLVRPQVWGHLQAVANEHKANLFFGVCPRFRGGQQYDLAWQIRMVRVLWADLDHCAPEEALKRCKAAGLPWPSIVVNSGHGVHLYWILAKPYLIDDAGDPPPVLKNILQRWS